MIVLILLSVIPIVAYWVAYKMGKFWAQLLINVVALFLPDVVPLVDEVCMTTVSVAGLINRKFMPAIMKIAYWVLGVGLVLALIGVMLLALFD